MKKELKKAAKKGLEFTKLYWLGYGKGTLVAAAIVMPFLWILAWFCRNSDIE